MGVRKLARAGLVAAAAVALGALPASAQNLTFSTTGALSGTGCAANVCTSGGFTLSFIDAGSAAYFAPTLIDLGQFQTTAAGGTQPLTAFSGVTFTLTINQTVPSVGSGAFTGSISGNLAYNPSTSSLVWTPTTSTLNIGSASYALVVDNTGNINIQAPVVGGNPNVTSVKANVNVTPEPATALLLAPGLLGLAAYRRRRSAK